MNELKNTTSSMPDPKILEELLLKGDLRQLSPVQKISYYKEVCNSIGLNPITKPFDYLILNNKEVLYANKNCTEQLRQQYRISISITEKKFESGLFIVTARAESNGRYDESTGVVNTTGLKGEALANAIMKAETKSKRRVTLSFAGLGMLDETEVETIPGAKTVYHEPSSFPSLSEVTAHDKMPEPTTSSDSRAWLGKLPSNIVATLKAIGYNTPKLAHDKWLQCQANGALDNDDFKVILDAELELLNGAKP